MEAGDSVEEDLRERDPAGIVERESEAERQARPRIDHEGHPRAPYETGERGPRHQLDVELRVIDVGKLEDTVGIRRKPIGTESQRPLQLIAGAGALAGADQLRSCHGLSVHVEQSHGSAA